MKQKRNPLIAITMGDPAGIGPEVTVKALSNANIFEKCKPFVIGNISALKEAMHLVDKTMSIRLIQSLSDVTGRNDTVEVLDPGNLDYDTIDKGQVSAKAGKASVEWIIEAGSLAGNGEIDGIVTAPINKEACGQAGFKDVGHMEIFQRYSGASEVATMLVADSLRVVHLTTHRSLSVACSYVTKNLILSKIVLTNETFKEWGFLSPRIGVAALNPHASDGGLIGNEEKTQISPAVTEAYGLGIDVIGPVPADTIFNQAIDGKFDVVLAMYHDQGHIPIKVHNWSKSVSINLGLPFIRTSVDHGTAFDIAGQGVANHESMLEAIKIAAELAKNKQLL